MGVCKAEEILNEIGDNDILFSEGKYAGVSGLVALCWQGYR